MTWTRLTHGTLITHLGLGDAPAVHLDGAVIWRGERIVAAGDAAQLAREHPEAHVPGVRVLDARGGLILPGLVNLHHHFYSALARGLDPGTPMHDFPEVLDRLWWRLDRALDLPSIRVSAELSAAECVRWGTTTVFDHHASPSAIDGSLDAIAEPLEQAGLSAVLCYEITDRNGPAGAAAGLAENLRFLRGRANDPRIRGMMGLHAGFTLREETLAEIARRRPEGAGCHVHVAEHPSDVERCRAVFGAGPVERLERHGLLDERALLAHGIHLDAAAYDLIAERGATLQHNPESNANNSVGRLDAVAAMARGCAVGLGTDGMSSNVLRAWRAAFLAHRAATDPTTGFDGLPRLQATNVRVARRFLGEHLLGEPLLGELTAGAPADLIVLDAPTPTPLHDGNVFGHLIYGAAESPVRHTIARGRVLLEDFEHKTLDPRAIAARARELAPALWERFHALAWGTPDLG